MFSKFCCCRCVKCVYRLERVKVICVLYSIGFTKSVIINMSKYLVYMQTKSIHTCIYMYCYCSRLCNIGIRTWPRSTGRQTIFLCSSHSSTSRLRIRWSLLTNAMFWFTRFTKVIFCFTLWEFITQHCSIISFFMTNFCVTRILQ